MLRLNTKVRLRVALRRPFNGLHTSVFLVGLQGLSWSGGILWGFLTKIWAGPQVQSWGFGLSGFQVVEVVGLSKLSDDPVVGCQLLQI